MISAKELRIGNLVYAPKALVLSEMPTAEMNDLITYKIVFLSEDGAHCKLYEPIPLTPEILEKCGFEKSEPEGWYKIKPTPLSQSMELFMPDNEPFHYVDGAFNPELNFLHQLQNLYFALTGEELTVNLTQPQLT